MASKVFYSVVAVVGIAAASGAAWWHLSKSQTPQEFSGNTSGAAGMPSGAVSAPAAGASAPRPAGVEVAKVEKTSLQDDAQSVGSLRSRQSVMLRPEVAGRVKQLSFADGQRVRKGQVLVQLDDVLQRAEIRQAQAQMSIAQANLKRNQELVAQNFVAQRVLEESAASLQVAEAQLALSCARLSRMAIVAPFDAVAGIRSVNLGDYVKDGADLINLEDTSSMYVDFRLPERFQGKVRLQQTVELTLDAFPGRAFKAKIEAIDPLLDVNGRSVGIRAVLPNTLGEAVRGGSGSRPGGAGPSVASRPGAAVANPVARPKGRPAGATGNRALEVVSAGATPVATSKVDADGCPVEVSAVSAPAGSRPAAGVSAAGANPAPLRPGMFARVNTVFSINEAALLVPEEAVVPQGGRQFVIKTVSPDLLPSVDKSKLPEGVQLVSLRQEVRLGVRRAGKVEIVSGVQEGESVVVAGQQRLQRDGTPVRVVEFGRPSGAPAAAASAAAAAASR
jgi:membrane fusion protein, multidrug efflux system